MMADITEQNIASSDAALYFANSSSPASSGGGEDDDMNAEEDPGGKGNKRKTLQACEMFRPLPIKKPASPKGGASGPRAVVRLTPGAKNVTP